MSGERRERETDLRATMASLREEARRDEEPIATAAGAPVPRDEYTISEITALDGEAFVRWAYHCILRREPDDSGLGYWIREMAERRVDKLDIVRSLAQSAEAKVHGVRVRGLVGSDALADAWPPRLARRDDYDVDEILAHEDISFVENAYAAVLRREPDAAGLAANLTALRSGRTMPAEVLAALSRSPEGRAAGVRLRGLRRALWGARLRKVPVLGGALEMWQALWGLPRTVRENRRWRERLAREVAGLSSRIEGELEWLHRHGAAGDMVAKALARRDRNIALLRANAIVQRRETATRIAQLEGSRGGIEARFEEKALELSASLAALAALGDALQAQGGSLQSRLAQLERQVGGKPERAEIARLIDSATADTQGLRRSVESLSQDIERLRRQLSAQAVAQRTRGGAVPADDELETGAQTRQRQRFDALYIALEDRFRGSREEIRKRAEVYLPLIAAAGTGAGARLILDLGCGRGEWLELLRDHGHAACGVDMNEIAVEECRARGLDVVSGDALEYVRMSKAGSLGTITGLHIVEHLQTDALLALLDDCSQALQPGGMVIFETPNPENLVVAANNFYTDPTHVRPLPPQLLQLLVESCGFVDVQVMRLGNLADAVPEPFPAGDPMERYNPFVHALRHNFFSPPDYAVIARKPAEPAR